ncbi:MAG TPA: NAD-dependent epimerase/dehydratase family protein [Bryobacteraceae bacterium]|nr:NAD-dependent epimerase/dehydratase family protein [Bryobacteraceae bacterium]
MKVLVIGGTLFIGRGIVASLLKEEHEVTILHRKAGHNLGKKVREILADRNDPESLREALAGKHFDVVFDNVYDWERGTTAAQVEATAKAVSEKKLARYVFMSSVAAYGDGLNHHEGDALAPDNHSDSYVRNKAMSERTLFRFHQRNGLPVVTIRPPYIYGPGNPYYREAFFWDRLRDGRPLILPGDGRRLMQFVYIKDLVDACVRAAFEPGIVGHAFNVANPRPITQAELVGLLGEIAGKTPQVVRLARDRIVQAGGHPMGPNLYFGMYYDMPPITQVITKAQRMLHFHPTDFHTGLKETYRWYLRHHERNASNYPFEDKLIGNIPPGPL